MSETTRFEGELPAVQIFRGYQRGLTVDGLVDTFGGSREAIQAIIDEGIDAQPDLGTLDPERLIKDFILNFRALIEEATLAAMKGDPKDKIASTRMRMQGTKWLFELYQAIGILPRDLGTMGVDIDLRMMADEAIDYLVEQGVDRESIADLGTFFRARRNRAKVLREEEEFRSL